jgi:hypothetical protein
MAALCDAGVKHDRVAMVGAWAMWGADMRRMFADVARFRRRSGRDLDTRHTLRRRLRLSRPASRPAGEIRRGRHITAHARARDVARRMRTQDVIDFVEADVTALQ